MRLPPRPLTLVRDCPLVLLLSLLHPPQFLHMFHRWSPQATGSPIRCLQRRRQLGDRVYSLGCLVPLLLSKRFR
jgi:hypothetical protein